MPETRLLPVSRTRSRLCHNLWHDTAFFTKPRLVPRCLMDVGCGAPPSYTFRWWCLPCDNRADGACLLDLKYPLLVGESVIDAPSSGSPRLLFVSAWTAPFSMRLKMERDGTFLIRITTDLDPTSQNSFNNFMLPRHKDLRRDTAPEGDL